MPLKLTLSVTYYLQFPAHRARHWECGEEMNKASDCCAHSSWGATCPCNVYFQELDCRQSLCTFWLLVASTQNPSHGLKGCIFAAEMFWLINMTCWIQIIIFLIGSQVVRRKDGLCKGTVKIIKTLKRMIWLTMHKWEKVQIAPPIWKSPRMSSYLTTFIAAVRKHLINSRVCP
jgi:hypothetical protein